MDWSYLVRVKPASKSSGFVYLNRRAMSALGGLSEYVIVEVAEDSVVLRGVPEYAKVVKLNNINPFLEVDEGPAKARGLDLSGWLRCPNCRKYYRYLEVNICPYCDARLEGGEAE
jgi:uncharacterized protein YbaR (Trm112 family)